MTMADLKTRLVEEFSPAAGDPRGGRRAHRRVGERYAGLLRSAHRGFRRSGAGHGARDRAQSDAIRTAIAKRAAAEAVRARVAEPGADFAAVAAEVSDAGTKKAGGLLGTVKKVISRRLSTKPRSRSRSAKSAPSSRPATGSTF